MTSSSPEQSRPPVLIYDGRCGFCRIWVDYWRRLAGERVEFVASQDVAEQYPEISKEQFSKSVWLVYPDRRHVSGAEAAFELMAHAPGKAWLLWMYRNIPGFAPVSELSYRFIAAHRSFAFQVTRILWGKVIEPASHRLTRSLFLRGIGIVYLVAFLALAPQIIGLVGEHGILPVQTYSDTALLAMCWSGAAMAVLLIVGVLPVPATIGLYVLYLLVDLAGQDFLSFQWDALLLEAGFATILLAPFGIRPSYSQEPSKFALWVQRLLVLRLMLESGLVKWQSGDPTWRDLTALDYHFETQPLPTPVAWYVQHLSPGVHKALTATVFAVEVAVPFLFLMPRRIRIIGAWITIVFQICIALTGNYTFFNLLTIVLCVTLFDDQHLRRFVPTRLRDTAATRVSRLRPWRRAVAALSIILIVFGFTNAMPRSLREFQIVNRYGLFAVMTTSRPEIIIEGSDDGEQWRAYEFKYTPGPGWVAPYQPRLDWQMWFAALGSYQENPWFQALMIRLLEGSPDVLGLFRTNPFPDKPPRFVRALVYDYHFSSPGSNEWWTRTLIGTYFPAVSLKEQ
jgi:predicted DCC family thiol-disulfide oxidoreductase YuxK